MASNIPCKQKQYFSASNQWRKAVFLNKSDQSQWRTVWSNCPTVQVSKGSSLLVQPDFFLKTLGRLSRRLLRFSYWRGGETSSREPQQVPLDGETRPFGQQRIYADMQKGPNNRAHSGFKTISTYQKHKPASSGLESLPVAAETHLRLSAGDAPSILDSLGKTGKKKTKKRQLLMNELTEVPSAETLITPSAVPCNSDKKKSGLKKKTGITLMKINLEVTVRELWSYLTSV